MVVLKEIPGGYMIESFRCGLEEEGIEELREKQCFGNNYRK